MIQPPSPGDYAAFCEPYLAAIAGKEVMARLERQPHELHERLGALSDETARFRYGKGKWSVKEVVGHVSDAERVLAYRLLRVGRGDRTPLPGFDENAYVAASRADDRWIGHILYEFAAVREGTLHLIRSLSDADLDRSGVANDAPITVRALVHIIAGHAEHHMNVLQERYGV
jgi:uncharacterized damage-inducible protein DinB